MTERASKPCPQDPKTGHFLPGHDGGPGAFKPGSEWKGNPGGKPKGAQLSSAMLRQLAKELKGKRGGLPRTVADAIAEEMCRRARSTKAKDAVRAARELRQATEGEKLKLTDDRKDLKALTVEQLLERKAELINNQRKDAGKSERTSSRKGS